MPGVNPEARKTVLERDRYRCQFDLIFGISHLSGVACSEELEVHHKTYERFGSEEVDDLISVCVRCHDVITSHVRALRFLSREQWHTRDESVETVGVLTRKRYGNGNAESPVDGTGPADPAQR